MIRHYKSSLIFAIVAVLLTFAPVCFAANLPGISPEDAKQIMPVSQLKRGMRGYGLTVFQGVKIEKFDFEILGVLKQMNSGKDFILARIGGGPITTRNTGVIAGMSGSPCYINGKIIGAVSAGFSFTKEPVGMITPIADMLEAWDDNLPEHASGYSSPDFTNEPVVIGGKKATKIQIDAPGEKSKGIVDGVIHMQPLMTPLMVSGLSSRGMSRFSEILEPYHIKPVAGPGGGGKAMSGIKAELVPGAAVGVSLASGDIDMTGIGTLTYRRGNRILAFGHPMLGIGAIDAPMTTAFIQDVISSYETSTKLGTPIKTVGRIFQDRPWSIAGAVGSMAKTIPVVIQIDDQANKRNRTFRVNVINHPLLASRIATSIVGEAIFQTHPTPGDATAEVSYEVVADQLGKITRNNIFFDPVAIDGAAIADVGGLMQILSSNQFYPVDIKSVNVKLKIVDKRNTANIDRIFVKQSEYEPGETVEIGVVLRPYKKDRITKTFSVKIPATAADGKVTLQVKGGGTRGFAAMDLSGAAGEDSDMPVLPSSGLGGIANADNVKQLVTKYLEREKNNELVVQLVLRSTAMNVSGEKLSGLPSSIADIMKSSRNSGLKMEREEVKEAFPLDMIVQGSARLSINIKRKDLNESKPLPKIGTDSLDSDDPGSSTTSLMDSYAMLDSASSSTQLMAGLAEEPPIAAPEEVLEDEELDESPAIDDPKSEADDAKPIITASEAKPDASSAKPSDTKSDVKTIVRQVKTWSQKTQTDFAKGTFSGVSASSKNKLEISPVLKKLVDTPEQFVWSVAASKSGVYAGTGNSGKIYLISESGEMKPFYETGELEVHSVVLDASGNVYAATSPHGKIFKVSPEGTGKMLYKADEKYVVALAIDGEDNLYAGTGDTGKVYRISPDGNGQVLAELNEQQVLSLHWSSQGYLYVGTGINGIVYKMDKYGKTDPIFDANEDSITAVTSDTNGNVYAGTSPKGSIYKISADGRSKSVYTKATRVLSMVNDKNNNIYAVSEGTLIKIAPDETVTMLDSSKEKVQFLSLSLDEEAGALYAGTGNIGSVYMSKCCDVIGEFESPVHDAKMISKWGRIKWSAETPEGTSVELQTRTGNVATPDSTWTNWSSAYTASAGEQIASKDTRYIQYRVTMKTSKEEITPKVSNITVSYLTPNQKPDIKLSAPAGGEVWSGKETIKWVGIDPDKDTLTYDVFYSRDDGKEWTAIVGGTTSSSKDDKKLSAEEIAGKVKTELEKSPDVPKDMKQQVLNKIGDTAKAKAKESSAGNSSTSTSQSWDTSKLTDGKYILKVVASDKTSNSTSALTAEVISEPFVICNTPPKVAVVQKKGMQMKAAGSATISGSAESKLVEVVGVQFRVDGAVWTATTPEDGIFDSPSESFTLTTDNLTTGKHKVEVQAIDSAGNASTETVEVNVS